MRLLISPAAIVEIALPTLFKLKLPEPTRARPLAVIAPDCVTEPEAYR